MACAFFRGVSSSCPSTPGVRLPVFSVTRRTARQRALNERVRMNCRARTLRFLPNCCACTIRLCKRRTLRLACFQSMECQSIAGRRFAPAVFCETASSSRRIPVCCVVVKVILAERPRGSQHSYLCRDVVICDDSTTILTITIRHWLSPRSFARPPIGFPCGRLSAVEGGEGRVYHVPHQLPDRLGSALTPVVQRPR